MLMNLKGIRLMPFLFIYKYKKVRSSLTNT